MLKKRGGKKTPPRETESTPYKTRYPFSHSPPGQGSMSTNLLPIIAPRLEQSYVHTFQLTQKWVGLRSPKGHLCTVPLPEKCMMIPIFGMGLGLSSMHAHKHSSPLQLALQIQVSQVSCSLSLFTLFLNFCMVKFSHGRRQNQ